MGATNNIKETNLSLKLTDLNCSQCSQKFTELDLKEKNFDLWFDTTHDIKLTEHIYPNYGYDFTVWIRSIEHNNCPDTETCQRCWNKFLEKQMEEYKGEYYCSSCYQLIEKDHE